MLRRRIASVASQSVPGFGFGGPFFLFPGCCLPWQDPHLSPLCSSRRPALSGLAASPQRGGGGLALARGLPSPAGRLHRPHATRDGAEIWAAAPPNVAASKAAAAAMSAVAAAAGQGAGTAAERAAAVAAALGLPSSPESLRVVRALDRTSRQKGLPAKRFPWPRLVKL